MDLNRNKQAFVSINNVSEGNEHFDLSNFKAGEFVIGIIYFSFYIFIKDVLLDSQMKKIFSFHLIRRKLIKTFRFIRLLKI